MSTEHSDKLAPGTDIGGYRIECELGHGAMAVVYRAIQLNLQRPVALKVLPPEMARDTEFVNRFFNEARAAAALNHPNIVQAYDAGVADNDTYYFAMEYIEGETLLNRICHDGALPLRDGVEIGLHIAEALDYGWNRQRLTHGDIKPENIMLSHSGECKLADFGLAKISGQDNDEDGVMLTPLYAAPELIRGQHLRHDCRPDIYSFGATLYHILGGTPPFPGEDPQTVMRRHLHEEVMPLHKRNPTVPPNVSDYVELLLRKDPEQRPQSWAEISKRLRAFRRSSPTLLLSSQRHNKPAATATAKTDHNKPNIVWRWLIAALALMLFVVVIIYAATAGKPSRSQANATPANQSPVESARNEWLALKGKLPTLNDRELCRQLLENFGRRHGSYVPSDFRRYCQQYGAQDTSRPEQPGGTTVAPRPNPPPAATTTVPRGDLNTQLRTIESLAQQAKPETFAELGTRIERALAHPALTPREHQRLEALHQRLESLRNFQQQFQPPPPQAAGDNPQAIRERDTQFAALLYEFSQITFSGNATAQDYTPLTTRARQWLDDFTADSEPRQIMQFLIDDVISIGSNLAPHLVSHKEIFAGKTLANTAGWIVRDISLERGMQLEEQTAYGARAFWRPWRELNTAVISQLGALAFADAQVGAEQRRPYAAYLFLARNLRGLAQYLTTVHDDAERQKWRQLIAAVATAERNGKAAELWDSAQQLFAARQYRAVAAILEQLRQSNSDVAELNLAAINDMLATCQMHLPASHAAQMLQNAEAQINANNPAAALALVSGAINRFGNSDFFQLPPARNLSRRTFVEAARQAEITDSTALTRPLILLRLSRDLLDSESSVLLKLAAIAQQQGETTMPQSLNDQLLGVVFAAIGDWKLARDTITPQPRAEEKTQFPISHVMLCYVRARIGQRFATSGSYVANASVNMHEAVRQLDATSAAGVHARALQVELGIHTNMATDQFSFAETARQWQTRQDQAGDSDLFCALAAWLLQAGHNGDAMALLRTDSSILQQRGFTADDRTFFAEMAQYLAGNAAPPQRWLTEQGQHRHWLQRLLVTALLQRGSSTLETYARETVTPTNGTAIAAATWFQLLTIDLATLLARHDLDAAVNRVTAAIELVQPNLNEYYPRLQLLAAGLAVLQKQPAAVADSSFEAIRNCALTSAGELAAARNHNYAGNFFASDFSHDKDGTYWGTWRLWCEAVADGNTDKAQTTVAIMEKSADSADKQLLARTLRAYARTPMREPMRKR